MEPASSPASKLDAITTAAARMRFMRAVAAVAEGADVVEAGADAAAAAVAPAAAAALKDALRRVCAFGGREGMPRSLRSVYACYIAHFIGAPQWQETRYALLPKDLRGLYGGIAVSRDGLRLFIAYHVQNMVVVMSVWSGKELTRIRGLEKPQDVCVADDDFVFIALAGSHRVKIMTPRLELHGVIGEGQLRFPSAVCANADVVAVATDQDRGYVKVIKVFCRTSGALLHEFGAEKHMCTPYGLCFCDGGVNIAVAGTADACVWVFSVTGTPVRQFRTHMKHIYSIACVRGSGELVAAGKYAKHVAVFDDCGELVGSSAGNPLRVCLHGTTVITLETYDTCKPCRIRIWGQDLARYNDERGAPLDVRL